MHVKSTFLHRFPSTEVTAPKNVLESYLQTPQFHETHRIIIGIEIKISRAQAKTNRGLVDGLAI